jgi:hypothetical protein
VKGGAASKRVTAKAGRVLLVVILYLSRLQMPGPVAGPGSCRRLGCQDDGGGGVTIVGEEPTDAKRMRDG